MKTKRLTRCWFAVAAVAAVSLFGLQAFSQDKSYRMTEGWALPPSDLVWGQLIAIEPDAAGNIYAFHRCSASDCIGSDVAPLLKFDPSGKHLMSFAAGMLVWPHGLDIDNDGNIWITDGRSDNGRGQQVLKLSPTGEVLMTIGTAGVDGDGQYTFNGVSDVLVTDDGDVFVADGHVNNRIVKYSPEGEFIMEWGGAGTGPGEFNLPHALAMDTAGRLFVSDRENLRIQIFDQQGRHIDEWAQYGRVSGLSIDANDILYAAAQNEEAMPSIETGIFVASARDGSKLGFIPDIYSESVVADGAGSIYTGLRAHAGESQNIDDALRRIVVE
ncbi:MAG: peptidyl-alpha-hydroxyglycine alpha-amidating lyase family protein [Candidatus Rariloculaceae bacterium]